MKQYHNKLCGEPEHLSEDHELIEIVNDNESKQTQNKEQMTEIEQTRKNLITAWKVYFNYLLPQKMGCTKHSVKQRAQKTMPATGKVLIEGATREKVLAKVLRVKQPL